MYPGMNPHHHCQFTGQFTGRAGSQKGHALIRQKGVALIEVLVTILIVLVGFMGLAGLQTMSMKNNQSAYLRTQASYLAYDIIDKMRANIDSAKTGQYTMALNAAPSGSANCDSTVCDAANIAVFDKNLWKCSLGKWNTNTVCSTLGLTGYLPDGDGAITRIGDIHTIQIQWRDRDNTTTTFEVSTAL